MMRWLLLEMNSKNIGLFAVFIYTVLVLAPLWLAVDRLIWIAGYDVIDWIQSLERNFVSQGTFQFTLLQASISTIATLAIGIPIAWQLGRYKWPHDYLIRSILTMPFVMPSIVAAMGFLHLIGDNGLDIRSDQSTWFATLIIAHAWFCLLYTSPSPRDYAASRMPSSA